MIAYILFAFTGLTWLLAGVSAPDSVRANAAQSRFSIYEVTSPYPNQVVTDQVDIIGSVNSIGMRRYFVEFRRAYDDDAEWLPATLPGRHPVINGRLGTFNTTMLSNNVVYEMRLVVFTSDETMSTLPFGPIIVGNSPMAAATKAAVAASRAAKRATDEYCEQLVDVACMDQTCDISFSIDKPLPNQTVSGSVEIFGTVEVPDVRSYFVEFSLETDAGHGDWHPATLPRIATVRSAVIGTWVTTSLADGNYSLRLAVLGGDCGTRRFPIGTVKVRNNS